MADDMNESRTLLKPRDGTKVSLMIAALLLLLAAYFFWVPVMSTTASGSAFGCGSAASPPTDNFPKNTCLDLPTVNLFRAMASLAAAVIVGGLGCYFFGFERVVEERTDDTDHGFDDDRDGRERGERRRGGFDHDDERGSRPREARSSRDDDGWGYDRDRDNSRDRTRRDGDDFDERDDLIDHEERSRERGRERSRPKFPPAKLREGKD